MPTSRRFLGTAALASTVLLTAVACTTDAPDTETSPESSATAPAGAAAEISISPADEREERIVPSENVTGTVRAITLVEPNDATSNRATDVTFESGARSAWHSHPAGEHLIVTGGAGWLQVEGEDRVELEPGDVVWIPADVQHWQGATPDEALESIELQGVVDEVNTEWGDLVEDAEYETTGTDEG